MTKPSDFALIIGAMKSGTTSLFELLSQHPEIAGCGKKEPSYFEKESAPHEGWEEYVGLWSWDPDHHRVALEASVSYAKSPWVRGVPGRIAAKPEARFRFLYMMRNPLRRIESQVRHSLYEGWGKTLDEGMTDDLLDFSRYAMQIDEYVKLFPRNSLLLLTLEELQANPDAVLRRACEFLGVSPGWEFVGQAKPRNTGDFYQVPNLVGHVARSRFARFVIDRWPSRFRSAVRSGLGRLGRHRKDALGRWQLNAKEERKILRLLATDLRRLRSIYGVDVERHWGIPGSLLAD